MAASFAQAQEPHPGARAPDLDFKTLDGTRVRLSEFRGHPVVVTFWATWCPPCREEFPALVAAHQRHAADGLRILAVNQRDQETGEADIRQFLGEFPVPFPVTLDPRGRSRRAYQLLGLPTTVFIDSAGVIQRILRGPLGASDLDRGIAAILTLPAVPPE